MTSDNNQVFYPLCGNPSIRGRLPPTARERFRLARAAILRCPRRIDVIVKSYVLVAKPHVAHSKDENQRREWGMMRLKNHINSFILNNLAESVGSSLATVRNLPQWKRLRQGSPTGSTCVLSTVSTLPTTPRLNILIFKSFIF